MLSSRLLHSTDTKPPVVEWRSSFRFSTRPSKSIIQRAGGGEGETGEMTFFSPYEPMTARSASRFGKDEHVQQKRVYAGVDRYDLRVRSCCASYYLLCRQDTSTIRSDHDHKDGMARRAGSTHTDIHICKQDSRRSSVASQPFPLSGSVAYVGLENIERTIIVHASGRYCISHVSVVMWRE